MKNLEGASTVSRRIKILEALKIHGKVNVNELSETLGVTGVTIRNDLSQLEKKKVLVRARGGALKLQKAFSDEGYPLSDKQKKNHTEKKQIGIRAAELIDENDTIIIDSGSTTYELARNLKKFNALTVITNALNVASILTEYNNINIIVPGGIMKKNSRSFVGLLAERGFKDYFCDKLFLGVDGFDLELGVSTPDLEEAHLNRIMIEISKQVIVLADSSKFNGRGFAIIAPLNKIDILVTDKGILPETISILEKQGIKVIIA